MVRAWFAPGSCLVFQNADRGAPGLRLVYTWFSLVYFTTNQLAEREFIENQIIHCNVVFCIMLRKTDAEDIPTLQYERNKLSQKS